MLVRITIGPLTMLSSRITCKLAYEPSMGFAARKYPTIRSLVNFELTSLPFGEAELATRPGQTELWRARAFEWPQISRSCPCWPFTP